MFYIVSQYHADGSMSASPEICQSLAQVLEAYPDAEDRRTATSIVPDQYYYTKIDNKDSR